MIALLIGLVWPYLGFHLDWQESVFQRDAHLQVVVSPVCEVSHKALNGCSCCSFVSLGRVVQNAETGSRMGGPKLSKF